MRHKFGVAERDALLGVKGVGPKVVERFEQLGIHTLEKLATQDAQAICEQAASLVGATCWRNSPQARSAVAAAIAAAQARAFPAEVDAGSA
ncbi:helix-hairpin-helix domain-containing protein [Methylocystis heyeri]|uniref:helix-hairpin-helix domain-containing protein n=1 Tax=Methylocystis heyeri TaxID=391905 RepID=UPI0010A624A1